MRTSFNSTSVCQFNVKSMSPGKIYHLEPSSSLTRWLSECLRIFIVKPQAGTPLLSYKTGSNGEMSGRGEDSDAEEDKQGYRSGNAPVKAIAR
jgi:hypothetical protein